jgi:hypothetical protein
MYVRLVSTFPTKMAFTLYHAYVEAHTVLFMIKLVVQGMYVHVIYAWARRSQQG